MHIRPWRCGSIKWPVRPKYRPIHKHQIADIAQLVEQVIRNDQVVGSNPTIGSNVVMRPSLEPPRARNSHN
jgi:hypothetical protein